MSWPMRFAIEPTDAICEAMDETHGQVSLERAPHQELRKHYGLPFATEAA